jgi:hypothetical protein
VNLDHGYPTLMGTAEFGRLVKSASDVELLQLMRDERRDDVLGEVFRRMPEVFQPSRARGLHAVVHWHVGDRPDGGADHWEVVIADGACTVTQVPEHHPALTLTIGAVDFLRLVTGNAHAVVLVMRGRLRTRGDVALTAKFPGLFVPPKV